MAGYFITIKTIFTIQIDLSIIICIEVLSKSTLFMTGNLLLYDSFMFFIKIITTTSRNNVKFMECKAISYLLSDKAIVISRFLIY